MSDSPSSSTSADEADTASHYCQYRLRVTAGPAYDPSTHRLVPVNAPETLTFENDHIVLSLAVRIRNFAGYPNDSPETSPYFDHDLHKSDQYSIAFSFIPKADIPGDDLIFGNDFDRPIRDRLPPGFNQAFKIVKWWVDPGLDGDIYAEKPYLFGPALSSWNILRICDRAVSDQDHLSDNNNNAYSIPNAHAFHETVVQEGADGTGEEVRKAAQIPDDSAARKKHFLTPANRESFVFEAGRLYQSDFGNPYLDFNDFSLKLPGFSLNVVKYIDAKTHELRYTLKNKSTNEVYVVVMFTLLFGGELEQAKKELGEGNAGAPTPAVRGEGEDDDDDRDGNDRFEDAIQDIPPDEDDVD